MKRQTNQSELYTAPVQLQRQVTVQPAKLYLNNLSAVEQLSLGNLMSKSKAITELSELTDVFLLSEELQQGARTDGRNSVILFNSNKRVGLRVQPHLAFPIPITQKQLSSLLLNFIGGSVDCFGQPIQN